MPGGEREGPGGVEALNEYFNSKMYARLSDLASLYSKETDSSRLNTLALEVAQEASEERRDAYALIFAIAHLARPEKSEGVIGLRKIVEYIEDNQLVHKQLVPAHKPERHFRDLDKLLKQADRNLEQYRLDNNLDQTTYDQVKRIVDFTRVYRNTYSKDLRFTSAMVPHPYSFDRVILSRWFESGLQQPYQDITIASTPHVKDRKDFKEVYLGYVVQCSATIEAFRQASKYCRDNHLLEIFDPFRKRFGGINFKQLYEEPLDSSDIEHVKKFSRTVNKYLASLPKGDFIYDRAIDAMFLYSLAQIVNVEFTEGIQGIPDYDWFLKLSVWQQQLVDQIFAAKFAKYLNLTLPDWFIQEDINSLMQTVIGANEFKAGNFLGIASTRGVTIRTILDPMSFSRMSKQSVLYTLSQEATGLMDENEMVSLAMSRIWNRIGPELQAQLFEWGDREGYIYTHLEGISRTEREVRVTTETFIEWASKHFGQALVRKLAESEKEIQYTTTLILGGSYKLPGSRWGEEVVNVEIEMSDNSLAKKLGIRASLWEFPSEQSDNINLVLLTNNPDLALSGFVNLDSREIKFRFLDLPKDLHQLGSSMKLVAAATLHDILGRNIREWRVSKDKESKFIDKKQQHKARKWLPRNWYRVNNDTLINDFDTSRRKEKNEYGFIKPAAYVPAHVRRVSFGAVIEAMIEKYYDPEISEQERARLLKNIRDLRDGTDSLGRKLAAPDMDKIKDLPPAFQREISPRVDPDGRQLYTRTFVAPHFNPKLRSIDYQTFIDLYEASYRTHGSALAFLEITLAELSGIESETQDRNFVTGGL